MGKRLSLTLDKSKPNQLLQARISDSFKGYFNQLSSQILRLHSLNAKTKVGQCSKMSPSGFSLIGNSFLCYNSFTF